VLLIAAALTAAIVAAITANGHSGGSAAPPAATSHPARSVTPTRAASATHTTSPSQANTTAATATTSAAASTTTAAASASGSTAQQLAAAITHYYQLVPGNLDVAWGYLTAGYQQDTARGEANYKQFWGKIQSVSLSDLVAQPPSTVVVTLHYAYKNGQTVVERTSFGLVFQDGIWKIASSSVLSSQTQ
jgi:hypothetical protein